MSISVGKMAKRFGLSRSTLLYYHRIGLLVPSSRSEAGYRVYSEQEAQRLAIICRYRQVGLSLKKIREIMNAAPSRAAELLEGRLEQLNQEIEALRQQQRTIVDLLGQPDKLRATRALDKEGWVAVLRATGLDDAAMHRWHMEFERMAPQAHADFLASLGMPRREIAKIRQWSASKNHKQPVSVQRRPH